MGGRSLKAVFWHIRKVIFVSVNVISLNNKENNQEQQTKEWMEGTICHIWMMLSSATEATIHSSLRFHEKSDILFVCPIFVMNPSEIGKNERNQFQSEISLQRKSIPP